MLRDLYFVPGGRIMVLFFLYSFIPMIIMIKKIIMLISNIAQRDQKNNEMSDNWIPKFWDDDLPLFGPSLCSVSIYSWSCSSLVFVAKGTSNITCHLCQVDHDLLSINKTKILPEQKLYKLTRSMGVLFSALEGREVRPLGDGSKIFGSGKKRTSNMIPKTALL